MCNFLSVIVLKGSPCTILHKPGEDSHEALIKHFNVRERSSATATDQPFARVEFTPDWSKDVPKPEAWTFVIDEHRRPDWFDEDVEARVRRDLWTIVEAMLIGSGKHEREGGDHITTGAAELEVMNGRAFAFNSSQVKAYDSSQVKAYDSSQVTAYDSSQVTAFNSSQVKAASIYADIVGRAPYDGRGYPPVRCPLVVGKCYSVRGGALVEVEPKAA
jgi:hypothetical protein